MQNRAIELHDSTLGSVTSEGEYVVLNLSPAYIHQSKGHPGIDAGTGWIQEIILRIRGAEPSAAIQFPCNLMDGSLILNGEVLDNVVPIPLQFYGTVELVLITEFGVTVRFLGDEIGLEELGEPNYVDEFPGTK